MPIMKCWGLGTDNTKVSLVGYLMSIAGCGAIDAHSLYIDAQGLKNTTKNTLQKKPKRTNKKPHKTQYSDPIPKQK